MFKIFGIIYIESEESLTYEVLLNHCFLLIKKAKLLSVNTDLALKLPPAQMWYVARTSGKRNTKEGEAKCKQLNKLVGGVVGVRSINPWHYALRRQGTSP